MPDEPRGGQVLPLSAGGVEGGEAGDGGLLRRVPVPHPLSGVPMMPMLLSTTDRKMLTDRVLARLQREKPAGSCTNEDLRVAIEHEAAALVAEGGFIYRDGALVRRPTTPHECDRGWVSVVDPILGGLIDSRCPECGP